MLEDKIDLAKLVFVQLTCYEWMRLGKNQE